LSEGLKDAKMSQKDNLRRLILKNNLRLQKLKEKQALQGLGADPQTLIEIEDIESTIEQLQEKLKVLENKGLAEPRKSKEAEIVTGFNWSAVRQVVRLAFQYIEKEQKPEGVWLRSNLFPTSRTLFGLLTSGSNVSEIVLERSVNWLRTQLTNPNEMADAVAMAIIALKEAKRVGIEVPFTDGIEIILSKQNADGYWEGRYHLDRYRAASTAYCLQALRAYMIGYGIDPACQKACYKGARYLERYFRSLDLENIRYSDVVNPLEALMLPHYEAWSIVDVEPIAYTVDFLRKKRGEFQKFGNVKAVAGVLTSLLTEWRDFDQDTIGELLSWLLNNRNPYRGWSAHTGEPSEPHQTVMIALPIRQLERLGDHYIPLDTCDEWSLPIGDNIVKEYSVGAVLFRRLLDIPEIILLKRQNGTWVLPKGHIEIGEEMQTSLFREIAEETGIKEVKVIEKLGEFRYLFRPNKEIVDKTVTYFLVESSSGDPRLTPDDVHSEVRWFSIDDVPLLPLYYDDARQVIEQAKQRIKLLM
jgi:8-oxo-dGTP pyrophosphatase MutT (NUDIX family)